MKQLLLSFIIIILISTSLFGQSPQTISIDLVRLNTQPELNLRYEHGLSEKHSIFFSVLYDRSKRSGEQIGVDSSGVIPFGIFEKVDVDELSLSLGANHYFNNLKYQNTGVHVSLGAHMATIVKEAKDLSFNEGKKTRFGVVFGVGYKWHLTPKITMDVSYDGRMLADQFEESTVLNFDPFIGLRVGYAIRAVERGRGR